MANNYINELKLFTTLSGIEFNKINKHKLYKIIRADKTHHGFTYKIGLNIDTNMFYPHKECCGGGLYFADEHNIYKFIDYGIYICEITIPNNAYVYIELCKYKANMINIVNMVSIYDYINDNEAERLKAVRQNGLVLRLINNQSEEICMEAIKENNAAISYVINQTRIMHELTKPIPEAYNLSILNKKNQ